MGCAAVERRRCEGCEGNHDDAAPIRNRRQTRPLAPIRNCVELQRQDFSDTATMPTLLRWNYEGGIEGSDEAKRRGEQRAFAGDKVAHRASAPPQYD